MKVILTELIRYLKKLIEEICHKSDKNTDDLFMMKSFVLKQNAKLSNRHDLPVDSICLHPCKPILVDPQHQLKATGNTLDILRALQRTEANIYSNRRVNLCSGKQTQR